MKTIRRKKKETRPYNNTQNKQTGSAAASGAITPCRGSRPFRGTGGTTGGCIGGGRRRRRLLQRHCVREQVIVHLHVPEPGHYLEARTQGAREISEQVSQGPGREGKMRQRSWPPPAPRVMFEAEPSPTPRTDHHRVDLRAPAPSIGPPSVNSVISYRYLVNSINDACARAQSSHLPTVQGATRVCPRSGSLSASHDFLRSRL